MLYVLVWLCRPKDSPLCYQLQLDRNINRLELLGTEYVLST